MALFNCYFDCSGTQNDPWVIVTAGVVATEKKWARFEARWAAVLQSFGITQFHMKEFAHSKNEFETWKGDESRRPAFVDALVREVKRGVNKVMVQGVVLPAYRLLDQQYQLTEVMGGSYSLTQFACYNTTFQWLFQNKRPDDQMALFVEQGDTGQSGYRRFIKEHNLPEPRFIPKIDSQSGKIYSPLQAADLIAYEFRRMYEHRARDGAVPPQEAWRESYKAISKMLPVEARILDDDGLARFCAGVIPARPSASAASLSSTAPPPSAPE